MSRFFAERCLSVTTRKNGTMKAGMKQYTMDQGYEYFQSKLFPFAYNVIGDTQEAEDVVQEILNHHFLVPNEEIIDPERYLIRSVINRSINAKKRLKARKETYNGQWLPVPVRTEESFTAELDRKNILDYSLLVLLERLSPKERAVFILKESFDFSHVEIGEILDFPEENSRQLYRRGKKKLADERPVTPKQPDHTSVKHLTEAILARDLDRVKELLAENIQSFSDGGPNMRAARNVISGRHDVGRFLMALYDKYFLPGSDVAFATFNHNPGLVFSFEGNVYRCITFQINEGGIEAVYIVINPDKLRAFQS